MQTFQKSTHDKCLICYIFLVSNLNRALRLSLILFLKVLVAENHISCGITPPLNHFKVFPSKNLRKGREKRAGGSARR